ncbi:MAG: pyridoxal phosphate-dependent aminotransferase [Balneolaceae bacterium]
MKKLSDITKHLKQSDIRAVTAQINDVNGVNLGQGICDLPTPEPIRQAANHAINQSRSIYSYYGGIEELRSFILDKAVQFNRLPAETTDQVMVGNGSTGSFVTAVFTLLNPGDEVILFEPFYGYHSNILKIRDVVQRTVTLEPPAWSINFNALESAITPKTKAVILNTPTNPTGKVWSKEELLRLVELVRHHDLFLLTDEVYEYMTYDGHQHISPASLPGAWDRTVTLSSFSKTYNMTGWRMGYAIGPEEIIEKMGLMNDLFYICAPTPLQYGLLGAKQLGEGYFTEMRRDYSEKRELFCSTLEEIGFDVHWPQGAYYTFASFKPLAGHVNGFEDDQQACRTLIERAGVGSVPGSSFFTNPEDGRYYLRFCYAKTMKELKTACRGLRKLV